MVLKEGEIQLRLFPVESSRDGPSVTFAFHIGIVCANGEKVPSDPKRGNLRSPLSDDPFKSGERLTIQTHLLPDGVAASRHSERDRDVHRR